MVWDLGSRGGQGNSPLCFWGIFVFVFKEKDYKSALVKFSKLQPPKWASEKMTQN